MPIHRKLLPAGVLFTFFIFGFVDNLKGPLLPEMMRDDALSYSQVGTIFFAGYVGFIISTLLCGILADRISHRSILFLSAVGLLMGGSSYSSVSTYPLLIASMGVIGLGLGAIELGGNGLMVELHSATRGRYLNLLGTFHGLGSLTVPLFAAGLIKLGFSWQWIYASSACLAIPLAILFWPFVKSTPMQQPWVEGDRIRQMRPTLNGRAIMQLAFTKQMWLYYVLLSSYVALELGVGAWMIEYLQQDRGISVENSSYFLSSFFVLLMLGRLFGAFIVDAVGHHRSVAIALVGSCLCLVLGIFAHASLVFFIPLSGLFMSIVFPTVTASVSAIHKENMGSILGILFAFSGVGGAVGPWTVGIVSDRAGIELGIASTIAFGLLAIAALVLLSSSRGGKSDRSI
ncbi:MAG: MFS transporter [Pirellulaceae bacterium]|nr:MFS transporter [Pirellulaceae bacterium]